jgi:hypothetical protein
MIPFFESLISSLSEGVLGNLLAGAVASALTLGARWLWITLRRKRPTARLWGVMAGKRVEIVMTTAPERSVGEHTALVYPPDAIAAAEIAAVLTHTLKADTRLRLSNAIPATSWNRSLIVIGGPIHNEATRQLLLATDADVTFEGNTIVLKNGNRYLADTRVDENGETVVDRDYGLVLRTPNPYRSSELTTLLIGSYAPGCLVAARALLHENVRSTSRSIGSPKRFGLVASARVVDGQVQEVSIVESW